MGLDALAGVDEDVRFDWAASETCVAAFRSASSQVRDQAAPRGGWAGDVLIDFKGFFAEVFTHNVEVGLLDSAVVGGALRTTAAQIERLAAEAKKEQQRRQVAREWKAQREARNPLEVVRDGMGEWLNGTEGPPVGPAADPIVATVPGPPLGARREFTARGDGSGISSARPDDLRTFSSNASAADADLRLILSSVRSKYEDFAAGCGWGSVDARGVLAGFDAYIRANDNDARWAGVVADLFEEAGSAGEICSVSDAAINEGLTGAGVGVARTPVAVEPPRVAGGQTTSGYADDPVNTASGSFVEPETDLAFTGGAAALEWMRVYNSRGAATDGAFGPGWASALDSHLHFTDEAGVWVREDGAHVTFPRDGDGWSRSVGDSFWLTQTTAGFEIHDNHGGLWEFATGGELHARCRGRGTRVVFHRNAGRVVRVEHERGRGLDIIWTNTSTAPTGSSAAGDNAGGGARVCEVKAWDGRQVAYSYDEAGHLTAVSGGDQGERQYSWNHNGILDGVIDADGVRLVSNTYDEAGRVLTQVSAAGGHTQYTYVTPLVTQVKGELGVNVWRHDEKGRLVAVIDSEGGKQTGGWDAWGGQILATTRDGKHIAREFDERGRQITELSGGVLPRTTWDDYDRPVRISVAKDGVGDLRPVVTQLEYDGDGLYPSRVIDPEGGITAAVWDGDLLQEITDPTGRVTRFEYDAHGDVIGVINGVGGHARLERDEAGRITRSISPEGRVTRFEYDAVGRCVRTIDPAGAVWQREYSAAGRLVATIDPMGARTTVLVDDTTGEQVGTIGPDGRRLEVEVDTGGMVSAVTLPDGARWEYAHDDLSRLTSVTDPSGGVWSLTYDAVGHPTGGSDPSGVRVWTTIGQAGFPSTITAGGAQYHSEHDRLGRLLSQTGPDGASSRYEYDRCGRLVCAVDPDGGVMRYERDAAGRPVWVTLPSGLRYGYEYDAAGRWTGAVSTGGNRWSFAYDGDGNLVEEVWPTGEKVITEYDGAGRPIRRYQPGEGTTTVAYDPCGRVVRVRDPYWGVRKYTYTAAGQIETITNALGGVTRFEYDVNARPHKVIDPAGGVTVREYDAVGRVTAVTSPDGISTRITYDAAGRPIRQEHTLGATSWTYDKFGRLATETTDKATRTWEHDPAAATTTVTTTDEGGSSVTQWWWDWAGRTTRARSGTLETRWSYTADGNLEAIVRPDGEVTRFDYDAEGALAGLSRDGMGELAVERDMLGRVVSAHGDGVHMTWTWESGYLARFTSARGGDQTVVDYDRDEQGRILRRTTNGVVESFSYDEAGQLTSWSGPHGREEWSWDAMGRLRTHTSAVGTTTYTYNTAGQLTHTTNTGTSGRVEYAYDEAGRRTSERSGDSWRRYSWKGSALASVTDLARSGDSWQATAHWDLGWDTTGALATINGTPVDWQGTSPSHIGNVSVQTLPGLLTMTATPNTDSLDGPTLDGAARATGLADTGLAETVAIGAAHTGGLPAGVSPWDTPPILATTPLATAPNADGTAVPPPPDVAGVTARGSIAFGGLEVMGVRVYDQNTQQFLSQDPLPGVVDAPWGHNPYSYAANNPLTFSDPTGRSPVTDEQLKGYAHPGFATQASTWINENKEYIALGITAAVGIGLCATGVGAPLGAAILGGIAIGGVTSGGIQYFTTGSIDPKQLALDMSIGGVTGPIGGGVSGAVARNLGKTSLCAAGKNIFSLAAGGAAEGSVSGALSYMAGPGPHTVEGFATHTGVGGLTGGFMGGGSGAIANKLKGLSGWACFAPGTPVVMADGTSKPIEEVQVGDLVLAHNPHTGQDEAREVTATHTHEDTATWLITTADGGTITTTPTHRFWVEGKGWTAAEDLHEGDQIRATLGSAAAVVASSAATGQTSTVHNLTTDGLHTYYTLTDTGSTLLVHNTYEPPYGR